ncbi:hypothetical protein QRO11_06345 [Paracidovorax citrulli]|uniref:hypothetical protein n=1 Tax=Paracidovorax citrulli TaxID=80869 RepID=UPI0002E5ADBF|nr:hypothetical protein [Paracidovorax citrulli]QCX09577.1 hypothetical protein APS58_0635 [Paracidovorax citrulli]UEG47447.1 hypothetical protein LKW27_06145 [Paracidovorax citrulli]UMT89293.1 hypothetical protein FRC90_15290 [Paracidovorax citrulli]UMT95989.1 hypothetical protein FRC97_13790 [Paracidovorax citrulli]WIY35953.1 hypothetical protein QRO11_06345 [Paracidovorax citrulli]
MRIAAPLLAVGLLVAPAAWSANRACVIEGTISVAGAGTAVKDCMEFSSDVTAEQLKSSCDAVAQASAGLVGKPGKVTLMRQCPRPASGACKGLMGRPLDAYYYGLSADAIQQKRQACETSTTVIKAGTWSDGR